MRQLCPFCSDFGDYAMYERFTDRARKVMQLANAEVQRFHHEYIGTEHILLGLIKEGSGVAANVMKHLGVDLQKILREVERLVHGGPSIETAGKLPSTPRAKAVIEAAMAEARNLKHNYVGTEHILLGLLRQPDGVAAQVLMNLGLSLHGVREEILNLLGHGRPSGGPLKQAAAPSIRPSVSPSPGMVDWFSLHELAHQHGRDPRIKALLDELGTLQREKEIAVAAEDFEKAILLRNRQRELQVELQKALKALGSEKEPGTKSGDGDDG